MNCPNCRASLPSESAYCNHCGAAAAPPRKGSAPPYGAPVYTPLVDAPKRPVLLLAVLVAAVLGTAVMAGVFLTRRNSGQSLVAAQGIEAPAGPGVLQGQVTPLPDGPALTEGGVPIPPTGVPVTGGNQAPKDDGMAPSMLLGPGTQAPGAPSVVQGRSKVPVPTAPAVTGGEQASIPVPGGPVVQGTPNRQPSRSQGQERPAPRDHSDLDRYVQWLRYVEQERSNLRAMGETESFRVIQGFYQAMMGIADPYSDDVALQQQFNQNLRVSLQRTIQRIRLFRSNILRTKPPVPEDCRMLDSYYMRAMEEEGSQTVLLLEALTRQDIGRIRQLSQTGVSTIDHSLQMANRSLDDVYRKRGLTPQFEIRTGGGASLLGGLMGMGGLGGLR